MRRSCSIIHNYIDCWFFVYKRFHWLVSLFFLPVVIYLFHKWNDILLWFLANFFPSSICFSFNHNIPSLSTIVPMQFLSYISPLISTIFISRIPQKFQNFFPFISLYSLDTLFTETKSSWIMFESIKGLENRPSIVFNLSFPYNTILSCFFFFCFIIGLYFEQTAIPAIIEQTFIPTAEFVIPTGTQTNDANAEIETELVIVENKKTSVQNNLNIYIASYILHSPNHYVLFHLKGNFSFYQFFLIKTQGFLLLPYLCLKYLYIILLFFL